MPNAQLQQVVLTELAEAVLALDEERAVAAAQKALHEGVDPYVAVQEGLLTGMSRAGKLFEEQEYFVPELLVASDALYAGLNVLRPHIKADAFGVPGKVVIGVVEGDTHDVGKNLVRIILQTKGFEVHDLGRDVAPAKFVDKAVEIGADVIALSTLMTTTMVNMDETVNLLVKRNLRDQFKVIVGGSPLSKAYADKIGANAYARDAISAAEVVKQLVQVPLAVAG
jgi:corrinoid protein of di/trimethylamine methyltransferase